MDDRTFSKNPERFLHSIRDAREKLGGIGHTKFYSLVAEGKIKIVKIGRRSFITDDELNACVQRITSSAN